MLPALKGGCDVISCSEMLSFPWRKEPDYSMKLDKAAKEHGKAILGTGICPGFMPDVIPIIATAACRESEHINIRIFGDVYPYGLTVWRGMGLGLTPEEYYLQLGKDVDIEFSEPPEQVANAIGWTLDEIREENEPIIAPFDIGVGKLLVKKGHVAGFSQTTKGFRNKVEVIRQNVYGPLCSDLPPFWVEVNIQGKPNAKLRLELIHEDGWTTSTMVANMIPKVINAKGGIVHMKDLRMPSAIMDDYTMFLD